jgi:hypothetical protein
MRLRAPQAAVSPFGGFPQKTYAYSNKFLENQ